MIDNDFSMRIDTEIINHNHDNHMHYMANIYKKILHFYYRSLSIHCSIKTITIIGTMGSTLLALGSFGAGAVPTRGNWFSRIARWGIFPRIPTASAAIVYIGIFMLFMSWLLLVREYFFLPSTRPTHPTKVDRSLWRILIMWNLPIVCGFPLFSQDIYSYFAQGEMYKNHFNPYMLGPQNSLGPENFFTSSVPNIWRNAPSPYGPVFILLAKTIISLAGHNLILAVFIYRLLGIVGIGLCCWSGIYFAKKYSIDPSKYLIVGLINPLISMNAISAMHNDILMIGLAMCGMRLCISAISDPPTRPIVTVLHQWRNKNAPLTLPSDTKIDDISNDYFFGFSLIKYSVGVIVITLACLIKVTAILALPFVVIAMVHHLAQHNFSRISGFTHRALQSSNFLTFFIVSYSFLLSLLTMVFLGWYTDLGFSWVNVLIGRKSYYNSFFSVTSLCAKFIDYLSISLRFGSHMESLFNCVTKISQCALLFLIAQTLYRCYHKKYDAIKAIGWVFFEFMVLGPGIIQQWYLLWCLPVIALCYENTYWLIALILAGCSVFLITPGGHDLDEHLSSKAQLTCIIVIVIIVIFMITKIYTTIPPIANEKTPVTKRKSTTQLCPQ